MPIWVFLQHVTPGVDIPRVTSHGVTPLNRKKIQTERRLMKLNLSPGTEKTLHPGEFSPHDLEVTYSAMVGITWLR